MCGMDVVSCLLMGGFRGFKRFWESFGPAWFVFPTGVLILGQKGGQRPIGRAFTLRMTMFWVHLQGGREGKWAAVAAMLEHEHSKMHDGPPFQGGPYISDRPACRRAEP